MFKKILTPVASILLAILSFGCAVLGAILGPTFGALAKLASIRVTFSAVGVIALGLVVASLANRPAGPEMPRAGALARVLRDPSFLLGLWLNALPAFFFGGVYVLAPLAFARHGYGTFAIAAVFLVAGVVEAALNPFIGRLIDSRGRLLPIRVSLVAGIATVVALAATADRAVVVVFVVLASIAVGSLFTPGIELTADRAERAGLTQGLAFGLMNAAWAIGQVSGAPVAGALAGAAGDAVPYLVCSGLCVLTLGAIASRGWIRRRAPA